jgi:hypothetical protein
MSHKLKLKDWNRDIPSTQNRDLPPRLQLIIGDVNTQSTNFFTKKDKTSSRKLFSDTPTKVSHEMITSPVDATLRKLEFEMKLKALDNHNTFRGKNSQTSPLLNNISPKKIQSVSSLLGMERVSFNKREEPSFAYKGLNHHYRLNEDHSKIGESRSLLVRMKDEFKTSTNNSFMGQHRGEIFHQQSSSKKGDPILIKTIMSRPRTTLPVTPEGHSEIEKRENINHIKADFYNNRLSRPSRKECGPGGTLENLFGILQNDRSIADHRDSGSIANRSREKVADTNRVLISENKSEGRFSTIADFQKVKGEDETAKSTAHLNSRDSVAFPGDLISLLKKKLASYPKERINSHQLEQINQLSEDLIKIINSKS